MISWLRKKAEEAAAQLNMWDGGKTAQTVRQARQAPPAVTQRAPQQQQAPSYGKGLTGVVNRARDVVDANTAQDRYKRVAQNRPEIDKTYQDDIRNNLKQVKNTALGVKNTVDKNLTNVVNVARDQVDANTQTDRTRRLSTAQPEMYADQQRAKGIGERSINNNILERGVNFTRSAAEGMASGPLALGRGLGNAAAMMSGDYKRAQESEKINRDVTRQVEGTMWKTLNNPNSSQAQRDHAVKVLNQQAPQGMENLRTKIASENDPRRLAAAAADTALTVATAGMAGATKQGVNTAYKGAKAAQLATGATLKQATNAGVKAGVKNFATNTAKTAASGAGAGFAGAYTVDPNATLKQGLTGAVQGGVGGAVLPAVFMGPSYIKPTIKAGAQQVPKIVNKAGQSIDDVFNGVRQAYDGLPSKQGGFVANPFNKGVAHAGESGTITNKAGITANVKVADNGDLILTKDLVHNGKVIAKAGDTSINGIPMTVGNQADSFINDGSLKLSSTPLNKGDDIAKSAPIEKTPNPTVTAIEEAGAKIRPAVKQVDEPFDAPLAKTAQQPPTPPKPPTGVDDQKAIGSGIQKKSKFANETVPESDFVSQPIKDATKEGAPLYTPKSEREGVTNSVKRLKAEGDEKFGYKVSESLNKKEGTISRQEAIDAQVYAAKLEEAGDEINISKASEVYDKLSAHYTKAGQLIQAAAMMSKRSPAGMKDYANKQFAKAGVKVTPQIQQQVDDAITKLAKTAPETDANAKAMDEVLHTIAKNIPQSKADLFVNAWRANLLTAPTTTLGGFVGGVDTFVNRKLWTNPIATIVDMTTSLFTGKRSMTMAGGFASGAKKGVKTGVSKEYWKTGFEPMDGISGKTKYDAPRDINYGDSKAGRVAGKYVNGVYRTMGLVDKPWKYGAQKEALKSMAKAEGLNKGYKGKQLKQYVDEFIENPPEAALNKSNSEGRYAVFQDETALGDAVGAVSNYFRKKNWNGAAAIVDFVVPFKQIPGSIATRIIKRTPVGAAQNIVKQITEVKKGGQFDQRAFSQAMAEGSSSVPIIAAGYALAQAGQVTGGYPIDEKERKLWQAEGKQPNSVRVGDRWYSLNYIQPFGALLNIGAGAAQADKDGKDGMDIVWAGMAEGGKSVSDMSFLQGVSGAIDAVKNPAMAGERFIQNTASSVVPNFVRSFANASDKYERQASGIKEGIQSAIPGWRQQLPAKKDAYGNDVETKDNFLNRFVNPLKPSIAKNDDVTAELRRLKDNDLGTMPSSSGANALGGDTKLDKKQLTSLNAEVAKSVTEQWKQTMKSDAYLSSSDEDKKKMLNKVKDTYSKSAKYSWAQANGFNDYADKSLPKGLDKRAMEIISTYNEAKANDPSDNQYVKDTLKNWNNGEEVPVTNEIAKAWADYEKKRLEGKISNLEMNKEKKAVLRKAYSSVLNEDEKGYYNVSDKDIISGLEQGLVTQESLKKAMDIDALLVSKGLIASSGFGKTVWNALGLNAPKSPTAKTTGTSKARTSKAKSTKVKTSKAKTGGKVASKKGKYNYNLFMFGDAPTKSKSLRELVKKASAKA